MNYTVDPALAPAAPYLRVDQGGGYAIAATALTAAPARLVPGQALARPLWIGGERVALVLVQAQWGASAFTVHIPAGANLDRCRHAEHVALFARRLLQVGSPWMTGEVCRDCYEHHSLHVRCSLAACGTVVLVIENNERQRALPA